MLHEPENSFLCPQFLGHVDGRIFVRPPEQPGDLTVLGVDVARDLLSVLNEQRLKRRKRRKVVAQHIRCGVAIQTLCSGRHGAVLDMRHEGVVEGCLMVKGGADDRQDQLSEPRTPPRLTLYTGGQRDRCEPSKRDEIWLVGG